MISKSNEEELFFRIGADVEDIELASKLTNDIVKYFKVLHINKINSDIETVDKHLLKINNQMKGEDSLTNVSLEGYCNGFKNWKKVLLIRKEGLLLELSKQL